MSKPVLGPAAQDIADSPFLTAKAKFKAMAWFSDACTTVPAQRAEITASPLQAALEQAIRARCKALGTG